MFCFFASQLKLLSGKRREITKNGFTSDFEAALADVTWEKGLKTVDCEPALSSHSLLNKKYVSFFSISSPPSVYYSVQ